MGRWLDTLAAAVLSKRVQGGLNPILGARLSCVCRIAIESIGIVFTVIDAGSPQIRAPVCVLSINCSFAPPSPAPVFCSVGQSVDGNGRVGSDSPKSRKGNAGGGVQQLMQLLGSSTKDQKSRRGRSTGIIVDDETIVTEVTVID